MILEGSLTAWCVHLFVHNKLPEKTAVVGLVSLVLLEVVLGALRPHCWGLSSSWWSWACSCSWLSSRVPVVRQRGVAEMPLLPLSSPGWGWLCPHTRLGFLLEAVMATAGEESISWNIYLLNNLSSWLVVVLLVEAAVVHSECDKSVGNTWHLVFFIVLDAGQWPGNRERCSSHL